MTVNNGSIFDNWTPADWVAVIPVYAQVRGVYTLFQAAKLCCGVEQKTDAVGKAALSSQPTVVGTFIKGMAQIFYVPVIVFGLIKLIDNCFRNTIDPKEIEKKYQEEAEKSTKAISELEEKLKAAELKTKEDGQKIIELNKLQNPSTELSNELIQLKKEHGINKETLEAKILEIEALKKQILSSEAVQQELKEAQEKIMENEAQISELTGIKQLSDKRIALLEKEIASMTAEHNKGVEAYQKLEQDYRELEESYDKLHNNAVTIITKLNKENEALLNKEKEVKKDEDQKIEKPVVAPVETVKVLKVQVLNLDKFKQAPKQFGNVFSPAKWISREVIPVKILPPDLGDVVGQ